MHFRVESASHFEKPMEPKDGELTAAKREIHRRFHEAMRIANRSVGTKPAVREALMDDEAHDNYMVFVRHSRTLAGLTIRIAVRREAANQALENLRHYSGATASQPAV